MNKRQLTLIWIIGLYQIIGGLYGLNKIVVSFESSKSVSEIFSTLSYVLPFFIFSIISGLILITKRKWKLSIINFSLQIIQFKIGSFALYYTAGVYLGVGYIFWEGLFLNFSELATFVLVKINSPGGKSLIGINIISVILLVVSGYMNRDSSLKLSYDDD